MKNLYNHTKGRKIHPSPPPTTATHHLSLLPLAIATLAATLPPQDQQVLAYLLSISSTAGKPTTTNSGAGDHPPQFNCNCFRCYTSFWVRWDASPNRKVIHEIIDAYEDGLVHTKKSGKNKKERKNNKCRLSSSSSSTTTSSSCIDLHRQPENIASNEVVKTEVKKMDGEDETSEKGSVRKIVSFIGERIWGVWGV